MSEPETYERYIDIRLKVTVETETYTLDNTVYEESYIAKITPSVIGSDLNSSLTGDLAASLFDTDRHQEMLASDIPSAIGDYFESNALGDYFDE